MKRCPTCQLSKPFQDFNKRKSKKDGLDYQCRKCSSDSSIRRRRKNPERARATGRKWRRENPDIVRNHNLKEKYGITQEDFLKMVEFQSGACALCQKVKELVVDHNHNTGKVRELLCTTCNTGLGKFGDSQKMLWLALRYLQFHDDL